MRIVGGRFRSQILASPRNQSTRPTSDRVRESLFNILANRLGNPDHPERPLAGHTVLDLFAGTGALGLESLSRGADFCLFMENDATARGLIRENCEILGVMRETQIYRRDATTPGPRPNSLKPFSLVFADPPYGHGMAEKALAAALNGGWLDDHALIIVEERKNAALEMGPAFQEVDRREYGDTSITLFRIAGTRTDNM